MCRYSAASFEVIWVEEQKKKQGNYSGWAQQKKKKAILSTKAQGVSNRLTTQQVLSQPITVASQNAPPTLLVRIAGDLEGRSPRFSDKSRPKPSAWVSVRLVQ